MHIPSLVMDLAMMLIVAGIVSIIFRKLNLPVILGYILAGFITSPYFPLFFNVEDQETISTLSELGVIIILFHIGLEFDFHKLLSVGSTAIVTAIVKMSGVLAVGYCFGTMIGLSRMNSVFLGAMLSISSTVVIRKAFDELGVAGEKYTSLVMGTLIMEDLFGVFIMVILSSLAVRQNTGGTELMIHLGLMGCYLVVWLLLGIFLLPTFLNKIMTLMNREMLVVLSLGICFCMALIARRLGFSVELGAFLAGSLFAGTKHAEEVEESTSAIKDMFSVIFFLSVGMLVDPSVIAEQWTSILPIAIIAILAKLIFASLGMVLSGQSLGTAIRSGFSLAPIGEFSYIIASLGISLGVMDSYLYPVIVAASVLTTLITPVLIRSSGRFTEFLRGHLPEKVLDKMTQYSSSEQDKEEKIPDWGVWLRQYFQSLLLYGTIMLVAAVAGVHLAAPALENLTNGIWAGVISCGGIYMVIALFLRPMLKFHDKVFTRLWLDSKANRPPMVLLICIKVILISVIVFYPIHQMFGAHRSILFIAFLVAILVLSKTDFITTSYLEMETRFLRNLNEKTIHRLQQENGQQEWLNEDINIFSYYVPEDAPYIGKQLSELEWGRRYDVLVVKIRRGERSILLPQGSMEVQAGDKLYVVGNLAAVCNLHKALDINPPRRIRTLRAFMETDYPDTENALACLAIQVTGCEPYCGQSIMNTQILNKGHCMILGIQKNGYPVVMPDPHLTIRKDDVIWVMGSNNNVGRLAAFSVCSL
ncbi:cation:proton antiporter [Hornefia butyriciproducens]|uniref:cation:proton antiporter domain-containing protein n=1 Tax=Hornefia butyriciproducens TaxID=2652293 RepID=UPI003D01F9DE